MFGKNRISFANFQESPCIQHVSILHSYYESSNQNNHPRPPPRTARRLCPSSPPAATGPPLMLSLSLSSMASACGMVTVGGTAKNARPPPAGGNIDPVVTASSAVVLPATPTKRCERSARCVILRIVVVSVVPRRGRRRPAFAPPGCVDAWRRDTAGDDVAPRAPHLPCIQDHDPWGLSHQCRSSGWQ